MSVENKEQRQQNLAQYGNVNRVIQFLIFRTFDLRLSDYALYRGAALEEQNMEFGKGHVIVFGHNVADQYLFGNLPRVRMGSKIYMYQGSKIFVYEVYEARSGWDTETAYVEKGIEGYETCTLVTCIGVYPTSARYFVKGKLVGVIDNLDSQKGIKDKYNWK